MGATPKGFANPIRNPFALGLSWVVTAAEMRAYCRLHGIPIVGPVLAKREYRTGPHPKSAYAHLPVGWTRDKRLAGQVEAFAGGDA